MGNILNSRPPSKSASATSQSSAAFDAQVDGPISIPIEDTAKSLKKIRVQRSASRLSLFPAGAYNLTGTKRCLLLILNNADKESEKGALVDVKNIGKVTKKLNFTTRIKTKLTTAEMLKCLADFALNPDLKKYDMCAVVVMGNAKCNGDSKMTAISGIDGEYVPLYDLIQCLGEERCPQLKGKPKIFLFQGHMQGIAEDTMRNDATRKSLLKDMFIANVVLMGKLQKQHVASYYVQALCQILMQHACDKDFESIIKTVEEVVFKHDRSTQFTHYDNFNFKKCYLNPV